MTLSDGALLSGVILIFFGLIWFFIKLYELNRDKKLLKTGRRTKGIITESVTYPNEDDLNSGQYKFIADFKTEKNETHYVKSRFASRSPEKYMNTEVTIIYDPDNPDVARFEHDISIKREVYTYIALTILGILLLLAGVFF